MIERANNQPEGDEAEMEDSPAEESAETATIPTSLIGGQTVQPGDVIKLKVVSSDEDTITVEYAHPAPKSPQNTADLAAQYDEKPQMMEG